MTAADGTVDATGPSGRAARVLVQALAAAGVRDVVLAPGSRSAPLAYALAEAGRSPRGAGVPELELHVRVDERSAGFLAVGLARGAAVAGEPRPVAVVTTSGTAVANLHPAVLEAHHAGLPLVVLTADRPHELRGTGANQTTEQVGLLEPVRLTLDLPAPTGRPGEDADLRHVAARAVAAATGSRTAHPGPVHLNLAFRDPLVPGDAPWPATAPAPRVVARAVHGPEDALDEIEVRGAGGTSPRTVVVAGDGAGPVARRVAEVNGWPLLAEPSSGARGGAMAVPAYRAVLGAGLDRWVERVVVLGRPTLSRQVQALLAGEGVEVLVVAPGAAPWPDAVRRASAVLPEVPAGWWSGAAGAGTGGTDWADLWLRAGRAVLSELRASGEGSGAGLGAALTGHAVAGCVAEACGPDDVLVVGSSNPVRDLDLVADWVEPPAVVANRGLAGIDGMVSTAAGVALAAGRPTRALLGDLTVLHDAGGLLVGPLERRPDLTLVVANDDGGSIFATLEHGEPEQAGSFERVFATPHGVDLAALCAAYRVDHCRVTEVAALRAALAAPVRGLRVVEVSVDRGGRRALGAAVAAAAHRAVAGLGEPPRRD